MNEPLDENHLSSTSTNRLQDPRSAVTQRRYQLLWIVAGLCAAYVLTAMCYSPSLNGPFLFDDIPNLEHLGNRGTLDSTDKYLEFITSGQSSPLGRPLSLATFVLDGQTWPTDSAPFRFTNLLIHLLNGLFVFVLARLVFLTTHKQATAEKLALLCATLWLLHPLLVSTTAYVIQRMTQLSCLFTLAGLICYMLGRNSIIERPRRAFVWIIGGMGICGTLALLSKENGILLPLYALLIELILFRTVRTPKHVKTSLVALLSLPVLAVVIFMIFNWDADRATGFDLRPFTLDERLLTQAVVLMDYLRQSLAPQLSGLGIFHDDFPISRGLFNPISTVISIAAIVILLSVAALSRKRWPLASFGILWFFAGHSLEAGPIALELYFEHRNYLPLLGPLIAVISLLPLLSKKLRRLLPLMLILFVGMESFLCWQAAVPWGSEQRLMQIALIEHPDSLRAQQYVTNQLILQHRFEEALAAQEKLAEKNPSHTATRLSIVNLRCLLGSLTTEQISATQEIVADSRYDPQIIAYFRPLLANTAAGKCSALGFVQYQQLLDALLRNPVLDRDSTLRGPVHYYKGLAYELAGELMRAQEQLDMSFAAKANIDIRMQQIVWSLEAGDTDAAQHYLTLAKQNRHPRFWQTSFHNTDLQRFQELIDRARNLP